MVFGLFAKKEKVVEQESANEQVFVAPGTSIRYRPELIDNLKRDHKDLLGIYTEIKQAADLGKYDVVSVKLNNFRSRLQDHLLTENVHLYIYISHLMNSDALNSELIMGFRKEMDQIAKVALNFLSKYESIARDKKLQSEFGDELATVGQVLGERIQREESTLYPMYSTSLY